MNIYPMAWWFQPKVHALSRPILVQAFSVDLDKLTLDEREFALKYCAVKSSLFEGPIHYFPRLPFLRRLFAPIRLEKEFPLRVDTIGRPHERSGQFEWYTRNICAVLYGDYAKEPGP